MGFVKKILIPALIAGVIGLATGGLGLSSAPAIFGFAAGSAGAAASVGFITGALTGLANVFLTPKTNDLGTVYQKLNISNDPQALGHYVFGETAFPTDMVYAEQFSNDERLLYIVAGAAHEVEEMVPDGNFSVNNEAVSFTGEAGTGAYDDTVWVRTRTGAIGQQHINPSPYTIGGESPVLTELNEPDYLGSGHAFYALSWKQGKPKTEQGAPARVTFTVKGAKVYDPRLDGVNTEVGGTGTHDYNDQSTWEYNDGSDDIGGNWALVILMYLLGWYSADTRNVEQVTNGTFDTDTDWTKGTGWSISGGVASASNATGNLQQTINPQAGAGYEVLFEVSNYTQGDITPAVGGDLGTAVDADGVYCQTIRVTDSPTTLLEFVPSGNFTGDIDIVSVKGIKVFGVGVEPEEIDWASFQDAANVCDTVVDSKPKYRIGGSVRLSGVHENIIPELEATIGGKLSQVGGKYYLWAPNDDLTSSTPEINDSDILREVGVEFSPSGKLQNLYNTVRGRYPEPNNLYQPTDYPPVVEFAALNEDGIERAKEHDFAYIQDPEIAQRIARYILRRSRFSATWKFATGPKGLLFRVFDVIDLNIKETNYQTVQARIINMEYSASGVVFIECIEEDSSIYSTTDPLGIAVTQQDPASWNPASLPVLTGLTVTDVVVSGAKGDQSFVEVSWNTPSSHVRTTQVQHRPAGYSDSAWTFVKEGTVIPNDGDLVRIPSKSFDHVGILTSTDFDFRARHVSIYNVTGAWSSVLQNVAIPQVAPQRFAVTAKLAFPFSENRNHTFTASGATITEGDDFLLLESTGVDPQFIVDPFPIGANTLIRGSINTIIEISIRRVAGTGWEGTVFYETGGHGFSSSYRKDFTDVTQLNYTGIHHISLDMTQVDGGVDADDWIDNDITGLRFDFGNSAADDFEIYAINIVSPRFQTTYDATAIQFEPDTTDPLANDDGSATLQDRRPAEVGSDPTFKRAGNLIDNGSFRSGDVSWDRDSGTWVIVSEGASAARNLDGASAEYTGTAGGVLRNTARPPAQENDRIRARAFALRNTGGDGTNNARIGVTFYDAIDTPLSTIWGGFIAIDVTGVGDWTEIGTKTDVTAPSGSVYFRVAIEIASTTLSETMWVDDVTAERVPVMETGEVLSFNGGDAVLKYDDPTDYFILDLAFPANGFKITDQDTTDLFEFTDSGNLIMTGNLFLENKQVIAFEDSVGTSILTLSIDGADNTELRSGGTGIQFLSKSGSVLAFFDNGGPAEFNDDIRMANGFSLEGRDFGDTTWNRLIGHGADDNIYINTDNQGVTRIRGTSISIQPSGTNGLNVTSGFDVEVPNGGVVIGDTAFADTSLTLQITAADSGVPILDNSFDDMLLEGSGNTGMSIIAATTGAVGIAFGNAANPNDGFIQYDNNTRDLSFRAEDFTRLSLSGTTATFQDDVNIPFGNLTVGDGTGADTLTVDVSGTDVAMITLQADLGTNDRNMTIRSPSTDSVASPFEFNTANAWLFSTDNIGAFNITDTRDVNIVEDLKIGGAVGDNPAGKLHVTDSISTVAYFDSTANNNAGVLIRTRHLGTPVDNDFIFQLQMEDDTGDIYGRIRGQIRDDSAGVEDGFMDLAVLEGGTVTSYISMRGSNDDIVMPKKLNLSSGDGQIQFPATQVASSNANTLDDYEEGSWTPVLWDNTLSSGEGQTYSVQVGRYVKIGKMVHVQAYIVLTSLGTLTTTETGKIGGLPFTVENITNGFVPVAASWGNNLNITAGQNMGGFFSPNTSYINLNIWDQAAGVSGMMISEISADASIIIGGSYRAAN